MRVEANQYMVGRRLLIRSDRTPAQTITIVTEDWLCRCNEVTGGCWTSKAVSRHRFPGPFESTVTTHLIRHDSEGSLWLCPFDSRLFNLNRDLASLAVGEPYRTYLRKMVLPTDLPMFLSLKWSRFQTSRANIHGRKFNVLCDLYRHRICFTGPYCVNLPTRRPLY